MGVFSVAVFSPENTVLVSVHMFVRTLSREQNILLAFSWAICVNAHEDARSPAKMQPALARREAAPLTRDAMQQCRKKTF